MTVFWIVYIAWFVLEMWIIARDRRPAVGAVQDRGSRTVLIGTIVVSITAAFFVTRWHRFALPIPHAREVGTALMVAGIALRLWSVVTLGRFFRTRVTVLADHKLVREGPYRVVRHPSYTGALVICAGLGLAMGNALSLAVMIAGPLLAFSGRVRIEERTLAERFGAEWTAHRGRTWALVPPVW